MNESDEIVADRRATTWPVASDALREQLLVAAVVCGLLSLVTPWYVIRTPPADLLAAGLPVDPSRIEADITAWNVRFTVGVVTPAWVLSAMTIAAAAYSLAVGRRLIGPSPMTTFGAVLGWTCSTVLIVSVLSSRNATLGFGGACLFGAATSAMLAQSWSAPGFAGVRALLRKLRPYSSAMAALAVAAGFGLVFLRTGVREFVLAAILSLVGAVLLFELRRRVHSNAA